MSPGLGRRHPPPWYAALYGKLRSGGCTITELIITRSEQASDPYDVNIASKVEYIVTWPDRTIGNLVLDWPALMPRLAALATSSGGGGALERIGESLRRALNTAGWGRWEPLGGELALVLGAAELYALPWEAMPRGETGLPLSDTVSFRYTWPGTTVRDAAAAPIDRSLLAANGRVPFNEHCDTNWAESVNDASLDDIVTRLTKAQNNGRPFRALHILAHGGRDEHGEMVLHLDPPVSPLQLARALAPFADSLLLVALWACATGDTQVSQIGLGGFAQRLHRAGIRAVLAPRYLLSVEGSILASRALRAALGGRVSEVPAALQAMRQSTRGRPIDALSWQLYWPLTTHPEPPPEAHAALKMKLKEAYSMQRRMVAAKLDSSAIDQEIAVLNRALRDGPELHVGEHLCDGRFELNAVIGGGGFGTVWQAREHPSGALVALKVLAGEHHRDATKREAIFRGARVMTRLEHPHIVRVLEPALEDKGFYFFTMELLPGGDLSRARSRGALSLRRSLQAVLEVGEALVFAHERLSQPGSPFVHRDVKPQNILLDENGVAKLSDFDLVRTHGTAAYTGTGAAMGSIYYAAPEQLEDAKRVDTRADVYGLAASALFCVAGESTVRRFFQRREIVIDALECSDKLKDALRWGLALEAPERAPDVASFIAALREAMAEPIGEEDKTFVGARRQAEAKPVAPREILPDPEPESPTPAPPPPASPVVASPLPRSLTLALPVAAPPPAPPIAAPPTPAEAAPSPPQAAPPPTPPPLPPERPPAAPPKADEQPPPPPATKGSRSKLLALIGILLAAMVIACCAGPFWKGVKEGGKNDGRSPQKSEAAPTKPAPPDAIQPTNPAPASTPTKGAQAAPPAPSEENINVNFDFVSFPGGSFLMGSPPGQTEEHEPAQTRVSVGAFDIGATEVTQAQWREIVSHAVPGDPDVGYLDAKPSRFKGENYPVERVSWCDAVRFTNVASRAAGHIPVYTVGADCEQGGVVSWDDASTGFRLPTEAEWEFATRMGTTTGYSFGDNALEICAHGNVADITFKLQNLGAEAVACNDGHLNTAPVKSFRAADNLYDLYGNVQEWTSTCWTNAAGRVECVVRGGAYDQKPAVARSAHRHAEAAETRSPNLGLRLAM